MSDYELDPRKAGEPEMEYAASSDRQEDSYRTGSTTPPKDHAGVVAVVLVLVILCCCLSSALSLLNIRLFAASTAAVADDPVTFVSGGVVTQGLESVDPTQSVSPTQPAGTAQPAVPGGTKLQINESVPSVENIPQEGALSWQQVYEKVIPSVASISCSSGSSGTAVVMSDNGYLITNAHVVEGGGSISVLLSDGRSFSARVVGSDSVSDLAVLIVDAGDLTPAEFGSSSALRVGDAVVAIGDPLGIALRGTMTDGIVSAINRDLSVGGRTMSLIQTSAALNSGNSGGPLVNCYGQVVGINTMKIGDYAADGGVEGLGFAIPMSTVKDVVDQLITYGYVTGRPSLGIQGQMVSLFYQSYYRLPSGMIITSIDSDSDAADKGLRAGDILLYANGVEITDTEVLDSVVNASQVGDTVEIIVYRAGSQYLVELTVTEAKPN